MIKDADRDYAVFSVPIVRKLLRRILNILITINHTHCISIIWGVVFLEFSNYMFRNFNVMYNVLQFNCGFLHLLQLILKKSSYRVCSENHITKNSPMV